MTTNKQFNLKNPAVKRILQEVKEMQKDPSKEYVSMPLEEDIFEWQFAIHGPADTEFEGGVYHGRIILPAEYPFKPPAFMLLTPSGRFETQTKICLSISQHHPEHWQPSWSVRTALVALIAFMPTKPDGALGSLDYTKEERRNLAMKSRTAPPKFGSAERQKVIDEIHSAMLQSAPPVPNTSSGPTPAVATSEESHDMTVAEEQDNSAAAIDFTGNPSTMKPFSEGTSSENPNNITDAVSEEGATLGFGCEGSKSQAVHQVSASHSSQVAQPSTGIVERPADDRVLSYLAAALLVAIIALLARKFVIFYSEGSVNLWQSS